MNMGLQEKYHHCASKNAMQLLILLLQDIYAFHEPPRASHSGVGGRFVCVSPWNCLECLATQMARLGCERQRHRVKGSLYQSYA